MNHPNNHKNLLSLRMKLSLIILLALTTLTTCLAKQQDDQDDVRSHFSLFDGLSNKEHGDTDLDGFTIDENLSDLVEEEHHARDEILREEQIEKEEAEHKAKHIFDKICPHGFFACDNGECISPKWRCDGHYDCDDFSDELNCTNIDPSIVADLKLEHISSSTPKPSSSGFKPQVPVLTYVPQVKEALNQLQFNSSQEPMMLFSTGLSIRGYWMRSKIYFDVVTMAARPAKYELPSISQATSIFFELLNIERAPSSSKSSQDESTTRARGTIVGLDMDPSVKEVYWVELGKDAGVYSTIIDNEQFEQVRHRREFTGPQRKVLVDSGLLSPEDIALDSNGKNLYITDAGLPAIVACSIRHSHCKIIAKENMHKPRAIIVDSSTGWIIYSDWGDKPGLYLVSMDGKQRDTLIDHDIVWPNGLAVDYPNDQLYWADARLNKIECVDLTSRKRRVLVRESASNPFSLSLFENRIYWSDWSGSDIRTCDKNTGNGTKTLMKTDSIYGIHIYHPDLYPETPKQANPCWSMHCSHLCLVAPTSSSYSNKKPGYLKASCACPESMALSVGDKSTCYDVQLTFLLINVKNYIAEVFPEKIGIETVEKIISSKNHDIHDIASDWLNYRLFFFDASKKYIYSADLNSKHTKIEQFIPATSSVKGLLYDNGASNLYWVDSALGTMSMCSVKSKFVKVLRKNLNQPNSLVLDLSNRVFYIALLGNEAQIKRMDIFGNEDSDLTIIENDIGQPVALHLDERHQRLYWADARRESIESLDLDVDSKTTGAKPGSRLYHRVRLGSILAFSVYRDSFLWTVRNGDYLYMSKMTVDDMGDKTRLSGAIEASRPISFKLPSASSSSSRDSSIDSKRIIVIDPVLHAYERVSPCNVQASNCKHACVLNSTHQAVCVDPEPLPVEHSNETTRCKPAAEEQAHTLISHPVTNSPLPPSHPSPPTTLPPPVQHIIEPAPLTSSGLHSAAVEAEPINGQAEQVRSGVIWPIVLLLLLSLAGIITLATLLILHRQGRLPRQVSQLSVSFVQPSRSDKDGAMLLLDSDA